MPYKLFDFSSDQGVEGEGATVSEAFEGLAQGFAHIVTDASKIAATEERTVDLEGDKDLPGTAVVFLNELVFLFDTDQFLVANASLEIAKQGALYHVRGTLRGARFDPAMHQAGRGIKAATYHDAEYRKEKGRHRVRIVVDL